jgi:hypothetical protein
VIREAEFSLKQEEIISSEAWGFLRYNSTLHRCHVGNMESNTLRKFPSLLKWLAKASISLQHFVVKAVGYTQEEAGTATILSNAAKIRCNGKTAK